MIGYRISRNDLETRIESSKPGWLARAKDKTEEFRAAGKYAETSSIWSEVKPVYMRLQGESKCIYCERKLESVEIGTIEQDVEHFRPKGNVRAWKAPTSLAGAGLVMTKPPAPATGYHLLPYDIFNYSAACKPCNSTLKSDSFPIAGAYDFSKERPEALLNPEKPLLIYPIGDFDANPEDLIGFHGISPMARKSGFEGNRALVTIEFFKLDDFDVRKNLARERATVIVALFPQLKNRDSGTAAEKTAACTLVSSFTSDKAPHANCARSFTSLYSSDPTEAEGIFLAAVDFVSSTS